MSFITQGEVSYHSKRIREGLSLEFGRIPQWNCPIAGKHVRLIESYTYYIRDYPLLIALHFRRVPPMVVAIVVLPPQPLQTFPRTPGSSRPSSATSPTTESTSPRSVPPEGTRDTRQ